MIDITLAIQNIAQCEPTAIALLMHKLNFFQARKYQTCLILSRLAMGTSEFLRSVNSALLYLFFFTLTATSNDIQEKVADSVNHMVKYFFKNSDVS